MFVCVRIVIFIANKKKILTHYLQLIFVADIFSCGKCMTQPKKTFGSIFIHLRMVYVHWHFLYYLFKEKKKLFCHHFFMLLFLLMLFLIDLLSQNKFSSKVSTFTVLKNKFKVYRKYNPSQNIFCFLQMKPCIS